MIVKLTPLSGTEFPFFCCGIKKQITLRDSALTGRAEPKPDGEKDEMVMTNLCFLFSDEKSGIEFRFSVLFFLLF